MLPFPLTPTRDAAHCPTLTGGGAETAVQGGRDEAIFTPPI